jgi:hypothetical protein
MTVTVLIVLIVAALALAVVAEKKGAAARKGTARPGEAGPPRPNRKRAIHPYWFLGALLLGAVLLRFGVNWIVVAGGMLLAGLRSLAPLIRFLPLLQSLRMGRSGGSAAPGSVPPGAGPGNGNPRGQRMTRHEALQIFGLEDSATPEDVQREYRRLMRKLHPDLGGSSYLAAKINEAKDVLS